MGTANYSRGDASVGTEPLLYPVGQAADSPAPVSAFRAQGSIMTCRNGTSPCPAGANAIEAAPGRRRILQRFHGDFSALVRGIHRSPCDRPSIPVPCED